MPTRRRSWLSRRFVFLSEVLGYCLSGTVFVGLIVTLFIRVDVTVQTTGELMPICRVVAHSQDFLLVEYLVANGEPVAAGQPIARVLLDDAAQRRHLARSRLEESASLLRDGVTPQSGAALKDVNRALAELPAIEDLQSIITSWSGTLRHEHEPGQDKVLPGETILARVCDLQTLEMRARIGGEDRGARFAVGQPTRVFVELLDEMVMGEVVEVRREEHATDLRLEFAGVPLKLQDYLRDTFVNDLDGEPLAQEADIVVGTRSLFTEMFGRAQHAR